MAAVRILGIDPGTLVVGFGCLEVREGEALALGGVPPLALRADNAVRAGRRAEVAVIEVGAFRLGSDRTPLGQRLLALAEQLGAVLLRLQPAEVALEEAFFGKSVQSALRIGEARGVVLAEATRRGLQVHQFAPARVKRCITGQGSAQKETVAAMVRRLLGPTPALAAALPADATDALAVALTRAEQRRSPLLQAEVAEGRGARRGRRRGWPVPPGLD